MEMNINNGIKLNVLGSSCALCGGQLFDFDVNLWMWEEIGSMCVLMQRLAYLTNALKVTMI